MQHAAPHAIPFLLTAAVLGFGHAGLDLGAAPAVGAVEHPPTHAPVRISWTPDRPVKGTVFTVRVEGGTDVAAVDGHLAGEPLHFRATEDGRTYTALAAVPVDATSPATLRLTLRTVDGRSERRTVKILLDEGDYAMEELTVAPRYGSKKRPAAVQRRIRREVARARAISRASHDTPRLWEPPFRRPRPSIVTSRFGNGRIFNGEVQSRHTGTDFRGAVGDPVYAPARGVVALVDELYLGGNAVYLDHGAGLVTAYLHLSRAEVVEGDTVEAGQRIGRVGATGRVTGPHLHWIVRYGGISVDGLSLPGIEQE